MVDNNGDSKKHLVVEFLRRCDKLNSKIDKNYQELIKFNGSLEDILNKTEKYKTEHEKEWTNEIENFYVQHRLGNKVNYTELRRIFNNHNIKFVLINLILNAIKNNKCYKCKNNLSLNCYFYFRNSKSIVKWELNKIEKFNNWSMEEIIFCSEDCFKQTYYSKETKQEQTIKQRERERERANQSSKQSESNRTSEQEAIYCDGLNCSKKISSNQTYYYNLTENDNKKFCSNKCYINFYGDYCPLCKKKYLITYHWDKEKYPDLTFCENCYNKKKLEEKKEKTEQKRKQYCDCQKELISEKEKWDCICSNCMKNMFEKAEKNKLEYNAKFSRQKLDNKNKPPEVNLNNQINNLKKEIAQLEISNNPQQKNLLNMKKQELESLEKNLKEKQLNNQNAEQKNNNLKLYLGIGMGILGLGLIGVLAWLFVKNRKKG